MKSDKHYKMSKSIKRMLATLPKSEKGAHKAAFITAEVEQAHNKKNQSRTKEKEE